MRMQSAAMIPTPCRRRSPAICTSASSSALPAAQPVETKDDELCRATSRRPPSPLGQIRAPSPAVRVEDSAAAWAKALGLRRISVVLDQRRKQEEVKPLNAEVTPAPMSAPLGVGAGTLPGAVRMASVGAPPGAPAGAAAARVETLVARNQWLASGVVLPAAPVRLVATARTPPQRMAAVIPGGVAQRQRSPPPGCATVAYPSPTPPPVAEQQRARSLSPVAHRSGGALAAAASVEPQRFTSIAAAARVAAAATADSRDRSPQLSMVPSASCARLSATAELQQCSLRSPQLSMVPSASCARICTVPPSPHGLPRARSPIQRMRSATYLAEPVATS